MEMISQYDLSRLPENTALKQQTLPTQQLNLSASVVLSIFFTTGGFCLAMGIILLLSAKSTKKIEINYTNTCANCAQLRKDSSNFDKACNCSLPFYLPEKMEGDVYMYYKLYGFYQNLYRYMLSRSNTQLVGKDIWDTTNCFPFQVSYNGTPIIPCGAIANSIFNDTITLSYILDSSTQIEVPMLKSGLTWWTDKYVKFRNPQSSNFTSTFAGSAKPLHWAKPIYELDLDDPGNNGFVNEDFIVWMRTAAFPTFKKLYRRLHRVHFFAEGLPAGNYSLSISYRSVKSLYLAKPTHEPDTDEPANKGLLNEDFTVDLDSLAQLWNAVSCALQMYFPVTMFQGEKSVVLSTLTWIGGGALFLGLTYTVTGALTLLASFAILTIHLILKRSKLDFV